MSQIHEITDLLYDAIDQIINTIYFMIIQIRVVVSQIRFGDINGRIFDNLKK